MKKETKKGGGTQTLQKVEGKRDELSRAGKKKKESTRIF